VVPFISKNTQHSTINPTFQKAQKFCATKSILG